MLMLQTVVVCVWATLLAAPGNAPLADPHRNFEPSHAEPAHAPVLQPLLDVDGTARQLDEWRDHKLLVVVFLGVECPMSKLYTSRLNELATQYSPAGVKLVGIFSNRHDGLPAMRQFAADYGLQFTILQDVGNVVADQFHAQRITQAFVLDAARTIRYSGRIDDQYAVGIQRGQPTSTELARCN